MNTMRELVQMGGATGPASLDVITAVISLLLAFILGQAAAWMYIYTHQGLSYSRAFVQSIILLSIIVAMAMMVIGSNIVIAFGLIGALSVIRFRNILKDTRDTAFVFFALINGMASGTGNFPIAILGSIAFFLVLLYLHAVQFGSLNFSDGFLRMNLQAGGASVKNISNLLNSYCRSMKIISERFSDSGAGEIAYKVVLRDPSRGDELMASLRQLEGVSNITFVIQEEQVEV